MVTPRIRTAFVALGTAFLLALPSLRAALPNYKLGDVAADDVITPVQLVVADPQATQALKEKVAQDVPFVVRLTPQSAGEAETELRRSIVTARTNFMAAFQQALNRAPTEADLGTPLFTKTVGEIGRESRADLPLDLLAPMWVRSQSEQSLVESMLQPVREVMAQPILSNKTDSPLAANQSVRLIPIKASGGQPSVQELETTGKTVLAGKMISLWRAGRLVETYFPSGQEELGRFAASFVRTNAYPDQSLTDLLRAKHMEGLAVNETYEPAQVIISKGQTIDRKALAALAELREKSLIGTLQTKLEQAQQEESVSGQIKSQTKWFAAGLTVIGVALVLVLWRLRPRPAGSALVPLGNNPTLSFADQQALTGGATDASWRNRAVLAEAKAERAQAAIRSGALGWMKEKIFQTMFRHRGELLSAQTRAGAEMLELEQRLEQLHAPLQDRITAYERRIEELERELAAMGEENRELIEARMAVAKERLTIVRERFRSN